MSKEKYLFIYYYNFIIINIFTFTYYLFLHLLFFILFTESHWEGGIWGKIRRRGRRDPCGNLGRSSSQRVQQVQQLRGRVHLVCLKNSKGQGWNLWGRKWQEMRSERLKADSKITNSLVNYGEELWQVKWKANGGLLEEKKCDVTDFKRMTMVIWNTD